MRCFIFLLKSNFLTSLITSKCVGRNVAPSAPLAASLVRYKYESGEKKFQEQLQPIYSKQELQKSYFCISFGQTSENKLELEQNFKKDEAF